MTRYKSGMDMLIERGLDIRGRQVEAAEFERRGIPLIVACAQCTSTMPVYACWVREDGAVICNCCLEEKYGPDVCIEAEDAHARQGG